MYVIISVSGAKTFEGILLAADGNRMRIALRDRHDTIELKRTGGQWRTEAGSLVDFESVISSADSCGLLLGSTPPHAPRQAA